MVHLPLTPKIDEVGNGVLAAYCMVAVVFAGSYLARARREVGTIRKLWTYENKAAVGMFTMFTGLSMKLGAEWWYLHLVSHGKHLSYPLMLPLFLLGTGISVWGLFCLLRSISRYDWNPYLWTTSAIVIALIAVWIAR